VAEFEAAAIETAIVEEAQRAGFEVETQTVEVRGRCRHCRQAEDGGAA